MLALARSAVANLNENSLKRRRIPPTAPKYEASELYGVIPIDTRKPLTCEIIARIVDGSAFDEFKAYGTTLVCGFARIENGRGHHHQQRHPVQRSRRRKGAHFIELCCQRKIPLVFLQNITGFMVGRKLRRQGHRAPRRR